MAKLVAEEGDLKGLILSLENGDSWVIGRDPDECQLVIEDPLTSRKHLIARRTPEGIQIENLSMTNPVTVNEEEVKHEPRLLRQGDLVKIGNEVFRFYAETDAKILEPQDTGENAPSITSLTPPNAPKSLPPPVDQDSLFEEGEEEINPIAHINFGVVEAGRWLLKVVGGPNNGAEFYMQAGHTYVLGTDPHECDIVFHDTSVSRQHAKITVLPEDTLQIEDLKSRNGVLIGGNAVEGKQPLPPSVIVTIGTTSLVVYDREGEMQTIISPLLPSIVKVLQGEETAKNAQPPQEGSPTPPSATAFEQPAAPAMTTSASPKLNHGHLILLAVITGVFVLAGITTASLFRSEPLVTHVQENANELIQQALKPYPAVKFSYNKTNGSLLLLGHVATIADKNQLLYGLQGLTFLKSIDDSGIIIDEYVWQEINSVLTKNPAWKGITVHSPGAGQFILSGYLATRAQAEQLSDYISVNFPYLDLLKKQIVVEEDVLSQISTWLLDANLRNVTAKMQNGEISLSGQVVTNRIQDLNRVIAQVKTIPGVRLVNNYVESEAADLGVTDITSQYEVTGQSRVDSKYTVVINGRFLSQGDILDGMTITSIKPNVILLEKGAAKYRIEYNK